MSKKGLDFTLKSVTSTELPKFDPTAKKKKKKLTAVKELNSQEKEPNSQEKEPITVKEEPNSQDDALDFDFGKKKKKKRVETSTSQPAVTAVTIAEVDGDYDYFSLLQRVCSNLGKAAETSTSLALPDLIVEPEGTTKTVWRNIARIGKKLNRDIDHIRKFRVFVCR